ncbi:hypothetical protein [Microtetraspora sp. AC03309]|uniref:hypothetical protein n=1 Tax=Microtetraspora sp. AC03309 TaxID=2779376 RepID=UPI001E3AC819|nr:hypothetical protein [Microtetraspora sp. AC03309]
MIAVLRLGDPFRYLVRTSYASPQTTERETALLPIMSSAQVMALAMASPDLTTITAELNARNRTDAARIATESGWI